MNRERIDWSQLWYPGPTREFTPDELARAGGDAPGRTLLVMTGINAALLGFVLLQFAPPQAGPRLSALMLAAALFALVAARRVWRTPSRRVLLRVSSVYGLGAFLFGLGIVWRAPPGPERAWAFGLCWGLALVVSMGLVLLALYRAEQIAGRLRETAERERRADMARQLAQAQIQPHFLFNSLASLQHWVQGKDDRAALLLDALLRFLRATLPLFDRRSLSVAEEAAAVREYLAVMQLRVGERLRWQVEVDDAAGAAALPPGLLLTLVENAIEHGVQPSLRGAEVRLAAQAEGRRLRIEVRDSGPGLGPAVAPGVGLSNARARLVQAFGDDATLELANLPEGGCVARIHCPLTPRIPDRP